MKSGAEAGTQATGLYDQEQTASDLVVILQSRDAVCVPHAHASVRCEARGSHESLFVPTHSGRPTHPPPLRDGG